MTFPITLRDELHSRREADVMVKKIIPMKFLRRQLIAINQSICRYNQQKITAERRKVNKKAACLLMTHSIRLMGRCLVVAVHRLADSRLLTL